MEESTEKSFMSWRWRTRWTRLPLLLVMIVLRTHWSNTLRTTFISCILCEWMYSTCIYTQHTFSCTGNKTDTTDFIKHLSTHIPLLRVPVTSLCSDRANLIRPCLQRLVHPAILTVTCRRAVSRTKSAAAAAAASPQSGNQYNLFWQSVWTQQSERCKGECTHLTVSPLVLLSWREGKK